MKDDKRTGPHRPQLRQLAELLVAFGNVPYAAICPEAVRAKGQDAGRRARSVQWFTTVGETPS